MTVPFTQQRPLRVVVAPDSFKESMTALEAAQAMKRGIGRVVPDAVIDLAPLSDGGDGFVAAMATALDATIYTVTVADALGRPRPARFAMAGVTAVIESAQAVGLADIPASQRNIWRSSTVGVGQLITAALANGAQRIIIGLGGTATNDGGAGMLAALGVRFLDAIGNEVSPTPTGLQHLGQVDRSGIDPRLAEVEIVVASDVRNPLCGSAGASAVFGPQKGATSDDISALDTVLVRLAELVDPEAADCPGAGAAGGLGWALLSLGASLRPGIDVVAEVLDLASRIAEADLILTGEGSVDAQTLSGKAPAGVTELARKNSVPVLIFAGRVDQALEAAALSQVKALITITPTGQKLPDAMRNAQLNLERATAEAIQDWMQKCR